MNMMQIPMTDSLKSFVQVQASKRGFSNPEDFVQSVLLDLERREKDKNELEAKLLEGVRSPWIEADDAFWREIEQELLDKYPELKSCDELT